MKYFTILLFSLSMLSFKTDDPIKVVFFGDSITQAGVNPGGYIDIIQTYLKNNNLDKKYVTIGSGIGGNKVYDLYLRLDEMLEQKPDVVVIYIGVNDVWHKTSHGTGTDADKFVRFYERIIDNLRKKNIRVVLATPAVIGERTDSSNPQDGDLNQYSKIIRDIATQYSLDLIDLRQEFLNYNLKNNADNAEKGILTTDRVHLNEKGNNLVAELMIRTLFKK